MIFRRYRDLSSSPRPLSGIIVTITLTAILIGSPIIAVYSPLSPLPPPTVLRVGFASATSSENNDDDNNEGGGGEEPTIDATTDGEDEVDGDGDVQEEDNTEEQQLSSSTQEQEELDEDGGEEEEEQLAFMAGEICDDFEDNDGDGFIDLADADCVAPLTQGAVTAPTTPSPPPSVTNTTATNSTNNTLTAGIAGLDRPYDLEKDCKTYEELRIPDPPLSPGDPPDVQWYHCPPGVGVRVPPPVDTATTTSGTGGEGGAGGVTQGQQQPPSSAGTTPSLQAPPTTSDTGPEGREVCDDFEDNDGDGLIDLADADCVAPLTQGTVTMSAPTTKINDNGGIATTYPDGIVVTNYPSGAVVTEYPDGTTIIKNGEPGYFPPDNPRPDYIPGVTHTTYPDETIIAEYPQGIWVEIPGFGSAAINLNGTSTFIEEARGNMAPNQYRFQPPATEMLVFLILVHLRL
jgi:hypothetical protein